MFDGPGDLEQATDSLTIYRDRTNGILVYWYGAPRDADVEDPDVWRDCNPASWLQEGETLAKEYGNLRQKGKMLEWRIYHLNQIMGSEESWLPDGAWAALREGSGDDDPWHGLDPALALGVGIEKSPASEGAAIIAAQRQGERIVVRVQHFHPESITGRVSVVAMREALRVLRERFPAPMVRDPKTKRPIPGPAFAFDPYAFTESAESLEQEGLNMVTMGQTASTMGPASTMVYELATTGRLVHDGDAILARHVADTSALLTERGMKVQKGKRRPNHSAMAMVMAVAVANAEAPKPYVRKPRIARGF
jgi:phage terminase large subunit-like protein